MRETYVKVTAVIRLLLFHRGIYLVNSRFVPEVTQTSGRVRRQSHCVLQRAADREVPVRATPHKLLLEGLLDVDNRAFFYN